MKLILSRKGFDSSAGGCPNPIFEDGRMLALPIPDSQSPISYNAISFEGKLLAEITTSLTQGRIQANDGAHLDPDMLADSLPREEGWQPLLGQMGAAQGHLRKQGVGPGDLFLFFGLFREAERSGSGWRFVPGARPRHVIWGWLQVGEMWQIEHSMRENLPHWAQYHPHCFGDRGHNNVIYVARKDLCMGKPDSKSQPIPGAGTFAHWHPVLQLTAVDSRLPSQWCLPGWFYPSGERSPLSYHQRSSRWRREGEDCMLSAAARGQEFVLDMDCYPEALAWLKTLMTRGP